MDTRKVKTNLFVDEVEVLLGLLDEEITAMHDSEPWDKGETLYYQKLINAKTKLIIAKTRTTKEYAIQSQMEALYETQDGTGNSDVQ